MKTQSQPGFNLTKLQTAARSLEQQLPERAQYGLKLFAFWPHQQNNAAGFTKYQWHAPQEVTLTALADAVHQSGYQEYINTHFSQHLGTKLAAQINANTSDGIVIEIPAGFQENRPLELVLSNEQASYGHIIIIARPGTHCTIIEKNLCQAEHGHNISLFLEEDSSVQYSAALHNQAQFSFTDRWHQVGSHGQLIYSDTSTPMLTAEQNIHTVLIGNKAQAQHLHLEYLKDQARYDLHSHIEHVAPATVSQLRTRVVVNDQAHMIYRGTVTVAITADASTSAQSEETILLSAQAKIDIVPILDINHDNVICSHSASSTTIDPDHQFYLCSRGLDPESANHLIIQGFLQSLLSTVPSAEIQHWLETSINSSLQS